MESAWPRLKTEMLINLSGPNFDVKFCFANHSSRRLKIGEIVARNVYGNENSTFDSGP